MSPNTVRSALRTAAALIGFFATADAAAVDAANKALPLTRRDDSEYASVIYSCADGYAYSDLVKGKSGSFSITVERIEGCTPYAIFHTHPNGGAHRGERFSEEDVAMAVKFGLASYIAVEKDGTVRVLDLGDIEVTKGTRRKTMGAPGRIVGRAEL